MRALLVGGALAAMLLVVGCGGTPGRGAGQDKPFGAQARSRNGPDPTVMPPPDAGGSEDPSNSASPH